MPKLRKLAILMSPPPLGHDMAHKMLDARSTSASRTPMFTVCNDPMMNAALAAGMTPLELAERNKAIDVRI